MGSVKIGSGSQNGMWQSKWWVISIAGMSKLEGAVKVAGNSSGGMSKWEVVVKNGT